MTRRDRTATAGSRKGFRHGPRPSKSHLEPVYSGLVTCASCKHARVLPDLRPLQWRCRVGGKRGGLVYRRGTLQLEEHICGAHYCHLMSRGFYGEMPTNGSLYNRVVYTPRGPAICSDGTSRPGVTA